MSDMSCVPAIRYRVHWMETGTTRPVRDLMCLVAATATAVAIRLLRDSESSARGNDVRMECGAPETTRLASDFDELNWEGAREDAEPLCEALFEKLATTNPSELLGWIVSNQLSPQLLSLAAEQAGTVEDFAEFRTPLLGLLQHPSPLVREGALLGLRWHAGAPEIRAAMRRVATIDASESVRSVARELIELE